MNSEKRTCQNCKKEFTIEPEDFAFYARIDVPTPKLCPRCRQQRRMMFRNFKTLYKRNSDRSMKSLVSMYSPQAPYKIWSHEEWWQDDWDPKSFGRDFDFSRTFTEQFQELLLSVPRFALMNFNSEACEYSNFTNGSKNCYLVFGCVEDEGCSYGHIVWESKDSLDNLYLHKSELCYGCVDCLNSYRLFYSGECEDCSDSIGLYDCKGCTDCVGCVGLRQKSRHIFNQPVSKEEYDKFLAEHPLGDTKSIELILGKREELRKNLPQKNYFGSHNNDVSGNHIHNAKNVQHSFDVQGGENSKFAYTARNVVDSYDVAFSPDIEYSYEALTCMKSNRAYFCHICLSSTDAYYSDNCFSCSNIFGCAGLKSEEYCIFNKKYSKEEYVELKSKIIEHMKKTGEWGEFFSAKLSPFKYNESISQEYFPLKKDEALEMGYGWRDDLPYTTGQETLKNDALPREPGLISIELCKEVLACDKCSRNYKLTEGEVGFYKNAGLLVPRMCFDCRHANRMSQRNTRDLWPGVCAMCGSEFKTSYSPEQQKQYKIYCETCYNNAVA